MAAPLPIPGVTWAGPLTGPSTPPVLIGSNPPGSFNYQYCYAWSSSTCFCDGSGYAGVHPGHTGSPAGFNTQAPFSPAVTLNQDVAIGGPPGRCSPLIQIEAPPNLLGYNACPYCSSCGDLSQRYGVDVYRTTNGGGTFYYLTTVNDVLGSTFTIGPDCTDDATLTASGLTPDQSPNNAYYVAADIRCDNTDIALILGPSGGQMTVSRQETSTVPFPDSPVVFLCGPCGTGRPSIVSHDGDTIVIAPSSICTGTYCVTVIAAIP